MFDIRYGLPTLFHRVEFAIGQQSKKHTYQFTGSQRECSFVLMGSHLSKFLLLCPEMVSSSRTVWVGGDAAPAYFLRYSFGRTLKYVLNATVNLLWLS